MMNERLRSLPSGLEHEELNRRLTQHFSEYEEIVGIKTVSDKKGGVCAFIQCQVSLFALRLFLDAYMRLSIRPF